MPENFWPFIRWIVNILAWVLPMVGLEQLAEKGLLGLTWLGPASLVDWIVAANWTRIENVLSRKGRPVAWVFIGFGLLFLVSGIYLLSVAPVVRTEQVTVVGPADQTEINRLNNDNLSLRNQLQNTMSSLTSLQQRQGNPGQSQNYNFDFSPPPMLKRKLIKSEAEVLIERLNDVVKMFRENRPPRFSEIMSEYDPSQRRRFPTNIPAPTLVEKRDRIAAARDSYTQFGRKLLDFTLVMTMPMI